MQKSFKCSKSVFTFVVLFCCLSQTWAYTLTGKLLERGSGKPMSDVNVFLLPEKQKTTTNKKGEFVFENVQEKTIQIIVNHSGYFKLEGNYDNVTNVNLFLEKESYSQYESTTFSKKRKRDQTAKILSQEQFLNVPGAGGDPVKAVQNLPGVNRVSGFSSQVVIQGSAPDDTKYSIDGHEIPIAFHFGGLTSVVSPESISEVEYLSAGYGAEYGRSLAGVINLKTRDADVEEVSPKGFFFVDTLKAGGLYETKIDDTSSFLIAGRYSYIGLFLKSFLKNNDMFDLTVAPEYSDLNLKYKKKLSEQDDLKVTSVVSKDTLGFLFKEPNRSDPSVRGKFSNETFFWRVIPQWVHKIDEDSKTDFSVGIGENQVSVEIGDYFFNLKNYVLTTRGEYEKKITSTYKTQVGFDHQYNRAQVDLKLPVFRTEGGVNNPISTAEVRQVAINAKSNNLGMYWRNEVIQKDFTFYPALRYDRFKDVKEEHFVDPRLAAEYRIQEFFKLKTAAGIYHQPPEPQERSESFGNPEVKSPKALHAMFGFERDFKDGGSRGLAWNAGIFDKWYEDLVIQSSKTTTRNGQLVPEVYNNDGRGRAYGFESLLKFDYAPLSGWLSYTYSKSQRWNPLRSPYDFEYDQTHNVNLVVSYEFPRNWVASGRYRYVTGNPYTPVQSGTFDTDRDVFIPQRGPLYSERYKAFNQVDFRLDKKIIRDKSITSVYLDIQNLLSNNNPENIIYAYDYSKSQTVDGLPLIAALGLKMEF